jgi:hypothetical protein
MPAHKYTYPFFAPPLRPSRPHLPVRLINPATGQAFYWDCLIDTGADSCLFPRALAELTGHRLKAEGVRGDISAGIEGRPVPTWKHSFILELLHPSRPKLSVWRSAEALIDCLDHDEFPALLGVEDFLCNFKVTLDYTRGLTTIEWRSPAQRRKKAAGRKRS